MKIYKDVPIPEPHAESKTAFVKDMKVGDSVLCSGGYAEKQALRVISSIRTNGFKAVSRTESGHGKNAKIRVWRIEGSATRVRTAKSRKVGKHTQASQRGKIIECPECSHQSLVFNFAWSKIVCLGCKAEIKKTDFFLPVLGKRQEAKVRRESDRPPEVIKPKSKNLKDYRARQYSVLQTQHFLRGGEAENTDKFQVAFDALYEFLHKSRVAVYLGELSSEEVKQLHNDPGFWNSLRDKFSDQEVHSICKGKKDDE